VTTLGNRLLAWFDVHGRHGLPWQRERTPYSVWVSEIMLQQTQVGTVIPFYGRFMQRFPTVHALAAAPLDDVLALWAGMGYYARARNLWRAARMVAAEHGGELPVTFDALHALPGIGRSTAGAILAQAHGQRWPILDGNVKRVLARYHRLDEAHTPHERVADYTQAIMDLGATLCTRTRPACTVCPLASDCAAANAGTQAQYPRPRPKRERPQRRVAVLIVRAPDGKVLLERRPARGIWGGLYSLPELAADDSPRAWCARVLGAAIAAERALTTIAHAFTHFDLDLDPCLLELSASPSVVKDGDDWLWCRPGAKLDVGVPAPVAALLSGRFVAA
jgi:A/G-specific adenine glycosylase